MLREGKGVSSQEGSSHSVIAHQNTLREGLEMVLMNRAELHMPFVYLNISLTS